MRGPICTSSEHAVRADADVVGQRDLALEHAADVDRDVAPAAERAANVDPRRVHNRGAGLHQRAGEARLHEALDRRELRAVVDAERHRRIRGDVRFHRNAGGDRQRDDVGQVVLALGVVVLERSDEAAQERRRRCQRAGIDLGDRALLGRRVALLDDGTHRSVGGAEDAAQARWVGRARRQHHELARRRDFGKRRVGRRRDQRAVAVRDERDSVLGQRGKRKAHGVAGPALRSFA